jgi:hypothetical protein
MKRIEPYTGFEQGPIRPPGEAGSLLIRVTRNCPWNRCAFRPVCKVTKFSLRPVEHVLKDIDKVKFYVEAVLIRDDDLRRFAESGLNRIHICMESGSDAVLKVKKGTDKATQILAGQKIKRAGMELSEYYRDWAGLFFQFQTLLKKIWKQFSYFYDVLV